MPEPRTLSGRERRTLAAITYEPSAGDPAAYSRRYRAGNRRGRGAGAIPVEIRNGLPFKPYVYRGAGWDIYTGDGDA